MIWSEDEHKSRGSAVSSDENALLHFTQAFLEYHILRDALCNSSLNILYPSSCVVRLHGILCDICSLVYHLLPPREEYGDWPVVFIAEPRSVPGTYIVCTLEILDKLKDKAKVLPQQR